MRPLIKYLPLICATMAVVSCNDKKQEKPAELEESQQAVANTEGAAKTITFTQDQYKLSDIQTGAIESRNLSSVIKMTGAVDAEPGSVATVSAPLGGYVKTAGLLPGQQVRQGQQLATLENSEFITMQQEYLEGIGRLEYLEQEFRRQKVLRDEDINAAKTFQQVSSELKIIKAKISGLEQQMALVGISSSALKKSGNISRTASLYAPISGFIKASNVNRGKYVAPTDVLFEIVGTNDLHLALNAFEKDMANIRPGQTVKFSLANESRYDRTAKVYLVGQATDNGKVIPVHCHLDKQSGLLPGMYVKALLETGKEEKTAVPTDAIVQLEGADYIIIQTGMEKGAYAFKLVQVSKGVEQAGYTAIELPSSITPSQVKVVTKNAYTILSAIKNAEEEE
ncbi:efflux RND transporter periplasmic adaptor subunit [Flavobacterium lindanitolerans]|uniref:efflux RND transporter periplasmic adaptor subunit n=1 Tax=Flavobacterium lindanitolerans TaxID=428988 RepID=UPI0023F14C58|nr:efflux RND transporter periplasmic adaptor subunit [Flavobacterium lindanitolerans]